MLNYLFFSGSWVVLGDLNGLLWLSRVFFAVKSVWLAEKVVPFVVFCSRLMISESLDFTCSCRIFCFILSGFDLLNFDVVLFVFLDGI